MEKLVETLGITRLSKSQVSKMARDLDAQVEAFRTRPLDAGSYTFVAVDALVRKVREGGRTVNVHALLATGVNAEGYREILGLHVTTSEDGAGWLAFFRDLTASHPARHAMRDCGAVTHGVPGPAGPGDQAGLAQAPRAQGREAPRAAVPAAPPGRRPRPRLAHLR